MSYLASRHELQRPQRGPHVWDVGLEVVESIGDAGLDFRRVLPRRAVGRNLVESGLRHDCGCRCGIVERIVERMKLGVVAVSNLKAV